MKKIFFALILTFFTVPNSNCVLENIASGLCKAIVSFDVEMCELALGCFNQERLYENLDIDNEIVVLNEIGTFDNINNDLSSFRSFLNQAKKDKKVFPKIRNFIFKCCLWRPGFEDIDLFVIKAICANKVLLINTLSEIDIDICRNFYNGDAYNKVLLWHSLHFAVSSNAIDVAKVLVHKMTKNFDDIDVFDSSENTPLHIAAICGNKEIVQLLIENGANPLAKNKQNEIPRDKAVQCGKLDIAKILEFEEVVAQFERINIDDNDDGNADEINRLMVLGAKDPESVRRFWG